MTERIREAKREMRRQAAERLKALPAERICESSGKITEAVLSSGLYREAESLFVYVSIGREPDTREIIRRALLEGKQVYVPRCGRPPRMEAVRIESPGELRPGRMGIPEPPEGGETAERADLVIVPCVSVSRDGRRLGHGGGYYDAFLRGKKLVTVCLCHADMMREDIPTAAEDERVEWVASGRGLVRAAGRG